MHFCNKNLKKILFKVKFNGNMVGFNIELAFYKLN